MNGQIPHSMRWACVVVALAASQCGWAAADDPQTPTPDVSSMSPYQDLLFLGRDRPLVIRLHLFVDGRPFADAWQDYVRRLFMLADGDGDGSLSFEELQSPPGSDDSLGDQAFAILTQPGLAQADLTPPDGVLCFDEFAAFVRQHGGGPFQPPPAVTSVTDDQGRTIPTDQSTNPGSILFATLDVSENGSVSREELRAGSESIHKLDFDGDGASSLDELDHLRLFGRARNMPSAESAVPVRALSPDLPTREIIQTVVSAYGRTPADGDQSLSITQLGFRDEQLAAFDADGNGRLDRDELRYWLTHPQPHVELVVRIGRRDGKEPVVVKSPPVLDDLAVRTTESGLVSLVSGDVHLEIGVGPDRRNEASLRRTFSIQFQQSDRDGNGYLEPAEVRGNPLFEEAFKRFDRDGNGKVFEDEMLAVVEGQIVASLSRTGMTTANRGKDLFEILDTNRDQRVSRRELLGAVNRFDLWDADLDNELAEDEVPLLYQLVFDRGTPQWPGIEATEFPVPPAVSGSRDAAAGNGGPAWFRKMDRNGDGDVSPREFLGTSRQFDQWDTDGNDLIDVTEAMTAAIAP